MPTYKMKCKECGMVKDYIVSVAKYEDGIECSHCDGETEQVYEQMSFRLLNSGWEFDNYGNP